MNGDDYSDDCVGTWSEAERVHTSDDADGPSFEKESLRRLTIEKLHGASEPTDNYSSGQHASPDHTLVYDAVYQSCRDSTACGSWDEIHSSTPNRKSKPTMHLNNLSAASINQSVTEYTPSSPSDKVVEQVPECAAGQRGVRPAETSFPDIPILFPTIESSSEMYPPDALLTTPDQHLSTGSPSTYILLATLGQGVYGKVFAVRLKGNPDDKIYTLKTIPKASLVQRGITEVTKELWILRLITDASLSYQSFSFLQKLKENFQDETNIFIVLVSDPICLVHIFFFTSVLLPRIISRRH